MNQYYLNLKHCEFQSCETLFLYKWCTWKGDILDVLKGLLPEEEEEEVLRNENTKFK